MHYTINTQTPVNAVSLAEARRQCRLFDDDTHHDERLTHLIGAATELAQAYTKRQLSKSNITGYWEKWSDKITLHGGGIEAVTQVTCWDENGTLVTLDESDYRFIKVPQVLRVSNAYQYCTDFEAVYDCGYAKQPTAVKHGILSMVSTMFANTDDFVTGMTVANVPLASQQVLDTVRAR